MTVLLHDFFFSQLAACTFWMAPGQALSQYSMRMHVVTAPWSNATISFYPAVTGDQWFTLDNVTMNATPSALTYGTDCVEPGDTSQLGGAAPPQTGAASPQITAPSSRGGSAGATAPDAAFRGSMGRTPGLKTRGSIRDPPLIPAET